LGFNLGATYIIDQSNFLGITYYSRIRQNTKGTSILGSNYSDNLLFGFYMPATTMVSYVHIFNPTWLINLQAFQSEWNANQYARIFNTAAPAPFTNFTFTMNFQKSYVFLAAARNQFSKKLGITFAGMVDLGPERENLRTLTFPSGDQYFVGVVGDYHFTAKTSVELLLGHVFSFPTLQNSVTTPNGTVPFTTGRVTIHANVADLKIKVEV
jgi:long-chain fatty acid transport protein